MPGRETVRDYHLFRIKEISQMKNYFIKHFMESLILAQSERWRRA